MEHSITNLPNDAGRYGEFGGRFVPETLMPALLELEESYHHFKDDDDCGNYCNKDGFDCDGNELTLSLS